MDPTLLKPLCRSRIVYERVVRAPKDVCDEILVLARQGEPEYWCYRADAEMKDSRQKVAEEDLVGALPAGLSEPFGVPVEAVAFKIVPMFRPTLEEGLGRADQTS